MHTVVQIFRCMLKTIRHTHTTQINWVFPFWLLIPWELTLHFIECYAWMWFHLDFFSRSVFISISKHVISGAPTFSTLYPLLRWIYYWHFSAITRNWCNIDIEAMSLLSTKANIQLCILIGHNEVWLDVYMETGWDLSSLYCDKIKLNSV